MSRARDFADLAAAYSGGALGNRNLVGNGNFAVHQRGGTITVPANTGTDTIDRWECDTANMDNLSIDITQSDDIPPELGEGFSYKLQVKTVESDLASNEVVRVFNFPEAFDCQRLGYGTANTKTTTLSFWVKSSIAGTFAFNIYADDGADNIGSTYTISSADTWEKKTLTFAGNTLGVINNDSGIGVYLQWLIVAGSDFTGTDNTSWAAYAAGRLAYGHATNTHATTDESTWQIAGVQWELGEVATPFEHISYADNLAHCQRYYRNIGTIRMNAANGDAVGQIVALEPTMRAEPVVTGTNSTGGSHSIAGTGDFPNTNIIYSGTAATSGGSAFIQFTGVTADAEL
jgi:hypothetical protein